ncbi:hypothetical protein BDV96DRAFT_90212 [Lophiotrema nucula]|uniref:Uncharacterized protein n=1 Tax=Lophiotrema nucula TaxID=690887 RepID=A0A6A5Z685_9PLEO|nr:hypothetical protein BDV96DRAFT_90212 [Lophiotrema nucula]
MTMVCFFRLFRHSRPIKSSRSGSRCIFLLFYDMWAGPRANGCYMREEGDDKSQWLLADISDVGMGLSCALACGCFLIFVAHHGGSFHYSEEIWPSFGGHVLLTVSAIDLRAATRELWRAVSTTRSCSWVIWFRRRFTYLFLQPRWLSMTSRILFMFCMWVSWWVLPFLSVLLGIPVDLVDPRSNQGPLFSPRVCSPSHSVAVH